MFARQRSLAGVMVGVVLLATCGPSACKRRQTLSQKLAGSWRATQDYGARTSKDPVVRGLAKLWRAGQRTFYLEVRDGALEVALGDTRQRATLSVVGEQRVELVTEKGTVAATVVFIGCDGDRDCLGVGLRPHTTVATPAHDALGYLFGCGTEGDELRCTDLGKARKFYRYPKEDGGT